MQTLLQCLHSPCVQLHASTAVHSLKKGKNPKHWQPDLFGHLKILDMLIGMGSAALAAAVPYPGKVTRISHAGQRSTKNKQKRI